MLFFLLFIGDQSNIIAAADKFDSQGSDPGLPTAGAFAVDMNA